MKQRYGDCDVLQVQQEAVYIRMCNLCPAVHAGVITFEDTVGPWMIIADTQSLRTNYTLIQPLSLDICDQLLQPAAAGFIDICWHKSYKQARANIAALF